MAHLRDPAEPEHRLPVLAFGLLGIYGRAWWLLPGVVLLGIGHIGIHLWHRREALS